MAGAEVLTYGDDGNQMNCACVDIGTNTTRLLVAGRDGGRLREVVAVRRFLRLVPDEGGQIPAEAVDALAAIVAGHARMAQQHGVSDVHVVGTAAIRAASNREELCAAVHSACGQYFVPDFAGRIFHIRQASRVDFLDGVAMHLHDAEHRLAVLFIRVERADGFGELGAREVRGTVQHGGDGAVEGVADGHTEEPARTGDVSQERGRQPVCRDPLDLLARSVEAFRNQAIPPTASGVAEPAYWAVHR